LRFQSNDLCSITERTLTGGPAAEATGSAASSSSTLFIPALAARRAAKESRKIEPGALKVHDLQNNGISDLDWYAANYRVDAMYGMVKPVDPQMRQGLHNLVTFITDHAIALAKEPADTIGESNKHYQVIYKYSRRSLEAGKEWSMGLTKSMLTYLDEALTNQQQSSSTILGAYIVVLVVLILQYLLLGHRVERLIARHTGMLNVIRRLMAAANDADIPDDTKDTKDTDSYDTGDGDGDGNGENDDNDSLGEVRSVASSSDTSLQ
jgi:hypothetical protein